MTEYHVGDKVTVADRPGVVVPTPPTRTLRVEFEDGSAGDYVPEFLRPIPTDPRAENAWEAYVASFAYGYLAAHDTFIAAVEKAYATDREAAMTRGREAFESFGMMK